ncbi:MAG: hypothetical protein IKW89_08475 [Bacteroidales bacterium]|nr:hypothetical protein [Bacteroidales bacterium]
MKNLLHVFIDDEGNLVLRTDNEKWFDENFPQGDLKRHAANFEKLLSGLVSSIWGEKNTCISKVIRLLSIAEICACSEPYAQAEEFWSMMMFDFIPFIEKYADSLKEQYGYDPESKQRPLVMGDTSLFRKSLPTDYN